MIDIVTDFQKKSDFKQVNFINQAAFETKYEANLVTALINSDTDTISLVARKGDDEVIGHILLSEMTVSGKDAPNIKLYGLAPMSVVPAYQKQGVGKALIRKAVSIAAEKNIDVIFVLGHPEYYPKFNFKPTNEYGISSEYDAPPEAFMALNLTGKLHELKGQKVCYSEIFQSVLS